MAEPAAKAVPAHDRALVPTAHPRLVLGAVLTISVCQFLDQMISNVALPHMRASLNASPETVTWVLTSFIIATAISAPINGWLADRIGSRNLFLGATALFLIASAACGAATTLPAMVAFRALQGVAAGFIGPMTQTILFDITPTSKHPGMTAIFSGVAMLAPLSGPFVGGYLTDTLNWRWCYYINLPIGIPALLLLWTQLPDRPRRDRPLDVTGFVSLALAIGAFQLMLDRGQSNGWFDSVEIITEAVIAVAALWVFSVHSFFAEQPLFPRALMSDKNFLGGCLQMMVIGLTVATVSAILPTFLQSLLGWPVILTGEAMAPRGLGTVCSTLIIGRLMRFVDLRVLIGAGFLTCGAATWAMTRWSAQVGWDEILIVTFFQGFGIGLTFSPMNLLTFGGLKADLRPDGASLLNLCRNIGGSVGITACVTLIARTQQTSHAELATHVTASTPLGPWEQLGLNADAILRMIDGEINRQAAMIAYLDCFLAIAIVLLVMALMPAFLRPLRRQGGETVHVPME